MVHAYWIDKRLDKFRRFEIICSNCKWSGIDDFDSYVDIETFNYCPNCGAKMDGEAKREAEKK